MTTKSCKYISELGIELEGQCTPEQSQSRYFHHDSSVEVCGNGSDDCDCDVDCDCEGCRRCERSDVHVEDCEHEDCLVCSECDERMRNCVCFIEPDETCAECYTTLAVTETRIACTDCQRRRFIDNSYVSCSDTYQSCEGDCGCDIDHYCGNENGVDGEMVSPPLSRMQDVSDWIRTNYPMETNTTCGSHQHTSFKRMKYYAIVMDREFQKYMVKLLLMWGKKKGIRPESAFFRRLRGDVHWCKNMYSGHEQINCNNKEDCRYRIVNYCWRLHGTMEVRVLPAFQDKELTVSAHEKLTSIIEQFIDKNKYSLKERRKTITMEVMV